TAALDGCPPTVRVLTFVAVPQSVILVVWTTLTVPLLALGTIAVVPSGVSTAIVGPSPTGTWATAARLFHAPVADILNTVTTPPELISLGSRKVSSSGKTVIPVADTPIGIE